MAAGTEGWDELVSELSPQISREWTRRAREDDATEWIRLLLLVDAHQRLSAPGLGEKIAATMGDLASEREPARAGWVELRESARDAREALRERLVEAAPSVLRQEQARLFEGSVEPRTRV